MYPTENTDWECFDGGPLPGSSLFCQTDNDLLRVGVRTDELLMWEAETQRVHSVLNLQYEPTVLTVEWEDPILSGDAETDIVYELGVLATGTFGTAWCDDESNVPDQCDQHYVRLSQAEFDSDSTFPNRALICHETGHAVGLTHGNDAAPEVDDTDEVLGCMRDPNDPLNTALGPQNVDIIDATYAEPDEVMPDA